MKTLSNKNTNGQHRCPLLLVTALGSLTLGSASAEITKVTSRTALEAASDQALFTDSLDGFVDDVLLGNGSASILSGAVLVSGTVDIKADGLHLIDTSPALYPAGFSGINSPAMELPFIFLAPGADRGATLTLHFTDHPDQAHAVGFDFSGAAGYLFAPPGILQTTWRVTTADGQSLEAAFDIDDGFLGFHSASSPIRTIEFFDAAAPGTDFGWEGMAIDNFIVSIPDQDGDGLHDRYEEAQGLDKTVNDADLDLDGDGLSNAEEYARHTDPREIDSDQDGLNDDVETNTGIYLSSSNTGTNPINPDTDHDGLYDKVETDNGVFVDAGNTGTDPFNLDSDGDGSFSDGEEVDAGSDPNESSDTPVTLVTYDFASGADGFTASGTGTSPSPAVHNATHGTWSFAGDDSGPSLNILTGPTVTMPRSGEIEIRFNHRYNIEPFWDGITLQISENGGPFEPVSTTSFTRNGYSGILIGAHELKNESAFENISPGYSEGEFITSVANLGTVEAEDSIQVRFLGAWDLDTIGWDTPNWELDSLTLSYAADLDSDGIADHYERANGLDPSRDDSGEDADSDGLSNLDEFLRGTNTQLPDTDGDGLGDAVESNSRAFVDSQDTGTDPLAADSDGDGLRDDVEDNGGTFLNASTTGTDPNQADSDLDGFKDGFELGEKTDPNDGIEFSTPAPYLAWTADKLPMDLSQRGIRSSIVAWTIALPFPCACGERSNPARPTFPRFVNG